MLDDSMFCLKLRKWNVLALIWLDAVYDLSVFGFNVTRTEVISLISILKLLYRPLKT